MAPRLIKPSVMWLVALALVGCGSGSTGSVADVVADALEPADAALDATDGDGGQSVGPSSDVPDAESPDSGVDAGPIDGALVDSTDVDAEVDAAGPAVDSAMDTTQSDATADTALEIDAEPQQRGPCPNCDDGDPCTDDECVVPTGTCVHLPVLCDDGDACTINTCSPTTGDCEAEPLGLSCGTPPETSCVDGAAHYYEAVGVCADVDGVASCEYGVLAIETCDDGDSCTNNACHAGEGCEFELVIPYPEGCPGACADAGPCEDFDPCTIQEHFDDGFGSCSCELASTFDCDDNNGCTIDSCDPQSDNYANPCVHQPAYVGCVPCTDGDAPCDDQDPCTADTCNEDLDQCSYAPACDDGNPFTVDTCSPSGACSHAPEPCLEPPPIDCASVDGVPHALHFAAVGTLVDGECVYEVAEVEECASWNLCCDNFCQVAVGCVAEQLIPYPAACSPANNCVNADGSLASCEDGNPCTIDYCDASLGIVDTCNGEAPVPDPCVSSAFNCDDVNGCTIDSCDPLSGNFTNPCVFELAYEGCVPCIDDDSECDDGDLCTVGTCDGGLNQCQFQPVECDDGDPCTVDACDSETGCTASPKCSDSAGGCFDPSCEPQTGDCGYEPTGDCPCDWDSDCPSWPACVEGMCVDGECIYPGEGCDDGEICTVDACVEGVGCTHEPDLCDDGNGCTMDSCNPWLGCEHVKKDCSDGDPNTCDYCVGPDGSCIHKLKGCLCDDSNPCTIGTLLDSGWCSFDEKDCDDGDPCTTDACFELTGACVHLPINCDGPSPLDACSESSCDPATGDCVVLSDCDDNDVCTIDSCMVDAGGDSSCVHELDDPCPDDGNPCTAPFCHSLWGCEALTNCPEDDLPCTVATCDPVTGCGQTLDCASDDACQEAYCGIGAECALKPIECEDDTPCTLFGCDPAMGCVALSPCDDGDPCTDDLCNPDDGDCTHMTADGCP